MKHSDQVAHALKSLHPDVRRDIRRALDDIDAGRKRDTKES
jgi:phage-related protein